MLVEPPRPRAPRRAQPLLKPALTRLAAAAGATALAASSRGDVVLLAVALSLAAGGPFVAAGITAALAGTALRWGSSSLGAIAGAQAVLGPAGWTGSTSAVASAWAAGVALVLAAPPAGGSGLPRRVDPIATAVPFGLSAALVAVGPGPGGAVVLRVVGAIVATAAVVVRRRWDERVSARHLAAAAAGLGVIALLLGGLAG